jgi:protein-L-isoaspartate(D-aspartate) O-methyltransferase
MGVLKNYIHSNHTRTLRNYQDRASNEKPILATIAKKFDFEYWDGDRNTGYGGYLDDGRWEAFSSKIISDYQLPQNSSILDIGCGKGFLLNAFQKKLYNSRLKGIDISQYAINHAHPEIKPFLELNSAQAFSEEPHSYDLVLSINTLHNLELPELIFSLKNIESLSKSHSYICVESYRNENEKWNLMRWQLTCECFYSPREWLWIFETSGYTGDYEFIYFE